MNEERDPALDQLDALVGEWDTQMTHPLIEGVVHGTSVFEWLLGRRFLIHRSDVPPGKIPSAISIIGGGDTPGTWPMHYFDSRGVMRIYQVAFEGGAWRWWRDHPGFSQRFTGAFEDGGRTMRGHGELQEDGQSWKPDLQVTYRRREQRQGGLP
ncbi:MAG: hypothetical protein ACRDF0_05585 [Candidatus Limnocylindria bacterium]